LIERESKSDGKMRNWKYYAAFIIFAIRNVTLGTPFLGTKIG
jgi:hypothetical protein